MINFFSETSFVLDASEDVANWIVEVIESKDHEVGEINYIFCDDAYLLNINRQFLNHDTLTDIISFDNSLGKQVNGEIYISEERVRENAKEFEQSFTDELHRVMIHGVLHYCGYKDKTKGEKDVMRAQEDIALLKRSKTIS